MNPQMSVPERPQGSLPSHGQNKRLKPKEGLGWPVVSYPTETPLLPPSQAPLLQLKLLEAA